MTPTVPLPRSIYARKLHDFPEIAFADQDAFQSRGKWREFFRHRIGPEYDGRVITEIGCADAEYLGRIAAKYPNTGFVGIDWKCKAIYDAARRVTDLGLRNIALHRARGQDVPRIFAPREVDEFWVFHPDPCARDFELATRLIGEPFLLDVHAILRDNTSILALKTDHPGYYQSVLGLFGLPEPHWFQTARERPAPTSRTFGSGSVVHPPRVRPGDLMPRESVAPSSEAIVERFDVAMNSADFWNEPAALAHTAGRCFSGETTHFEKRFIQKRFPIYYFEMRKK